eukprot:646491_1
MNSSPLTKYNLLWSYHHRSILSRYTKIHHPICENKTGHNIRWQTFYADKVSRIMAKYNISKYEDIMKNKKAWKAVKQEATKHEKYAGTLGPWNSLLDILFYGLDGLHDDGRTIIHFTKHVMLATFQRAHHTNVDIEQILNHYTH